MSSFSQATLIQLIPNGTHTPNVAATVHAMAARQWDAQVLLVGTTPADDHASPMAHPIYPNLNEALAAAEHSTLAIVDGDFQVTPSIWQSAVDQIESNPVQTIFTAPVTNRTYKRVMIWIYSLVARILFRTRRNELQSGLTVIDRTRIASELPDPPVGRPTGGSEVTRLLAYLKLQNIAFLETEINNPASSSKPLNTRKIHRASSWALRCWWNEIMFPRNENQLQHKGIKPIEKVGMTLLLLVIAIGVLFGSLSYPLIEPDEARNAQIALNLVNSGQWMSQTLANENYWDKPPLQIWAIAASYKLMGISPFATRFPVALAALATIMATLLVGKRLVGFRAAWMGAVLLLLSSGFVFCGRFVTLDASLTAMTSLFLMLGFIAVRDRFSKRTAIYAGIACGIGFLVKGPIILVLCGPPMLVYTWLSKKRIGLRWLWAAIPAVLIASPWFIATGIIHPDFLTYFFWKHHILRFSEAFNHREPFYFYLIGIFIFMFPASYLLPSAIKFMTSRRPENRLWRTREQGFLLLTALWVIGFFSISESKLPTYILPSFPPICLLMGVLVERKIMSRRREPDGKTVTTPTAPVKKTKRTFLEGLVRRAPFELAGYLTLIAIAAYVIDPTRFAALIAIAVPVVVLAALALMALRVPSLQRAAWASFGALGLLVITTAAHQLVPAISETRSVHLAASKLSESPEFADAPVVYFGRESYGAGLVMDESKVNFFEHEQIHVLINFLQENPTSIIVSNEKPMEYLRADLPWTITLEEREEGRHLYTATPNWKAIAREQSNNQYR